MPKTSTLLLPYALPLLSLAVTLESSAGAQVLVQYGKDVNVLEFRDIEGELWAATLEDGLLSVGDIELIPHFAEKSGGHPINVHSVEGVADEIWFGTSNGVYRLTMTGSQEVDLGSLNSERIAYLAFVDITSTLIIGTHRGVYRYNTETRELDRMFDDLPNCLFRDGRNVIWLCMPSELYQFDPISGTFTNAIEGLNIRGAKEVVHLDAGILFYRTTVRAYSLLYRVNGVTSEQVKTESSVNRIAEIDNALWFSWGRGVGRVEGNVLYPAADFKGIQGTVESIAKINGHILIGTTAGVYRKTYPHGRLQPIAVFPEKLTISGFVGKNGVTWAWGNHGVYRIYDDTSIKLNLNSVGLGSLQWLVGTDSLRISGVEYEGLNAQEIGGLCQTTEISGILELSHERFAQRLESNDFRELGEERVRLGNLSNSTVFAAVRDCFGNLHVLDGVEVLVVSLPSLWNYVAMAAIAIGLFRLLPGCFVRLIVCVLVIISEIVGMNERLLAVIRKLLVFGFVRQIVRKIYICQWRREHEQEGGCGPQVAKLLKQVRLERDTRCYILESPEPGLLSSLGHRVTRARFGVFNTAFPLELFVEDFKKGTVKLEAAEEVLAHLLKYLDCFDQVFCESLMLRCRFVFLCSTSTHSTESLRAICRALRDVGKKSYVVIDPYSR